MSEFSQYGGASDEWREIEKTIPIAPATEGMSLGERRRLMNEGREKVSAQAMESFKDQLHIKQHEISTRDGSSIQARSYRPAASTTSQLPVFLYFHGGGFMTGTLDTEDATCARIAITAKVAVLHINYRHTPEFPYPTAWNDAEDGFKWLHQNIELLNGVPEKVIVGGISSGAMLTAALILQKHHGKAVTEYPAIAGQVLMIPYLVHIDAYEPQLKKLIDPSVSSYKENEHAPLLPVRAVRLFIDLLKIENPDPLDLRTSPGNASSEQVRGLPPTTFGIAGLDPFRDEGLLFAKLLSEAGVPTDTYLFQGVPHAFRRFGQLSQAKRWDAVMSHAIEWSLSQPKAQGFNIKTEGP
ncbi:hypothetical protein FOPG_17316 [Fusarium oxysporum f. sp. conglutinans race 2 54008]|uniref:Alpha/beta hydrolase fold-3 domain-containing protein n=3 Tax=Fusarium oxysporum f. sp. conglutinans TaxID=100902 RepID=A0A8H6GMT5_FUSOX|nr:hypothetical protein FOXB_05305 [Fusarium oxysporum f. sp. conglutinans Fo5176]EXL66509.1 hypothetical protein FOPG_17316 [Fusarium oxysporum f. sp. conglutinans race 2 54008]KAF6520522.1 hypothetical protein HZS61_014780 [Fusarium oxysporum f. sp. conglutinans]KAI8409113.1 hypothetical protein FOFC_12065 [Fusarium oxysporum]KAG6994330.1 AB hydrolase superfamily protein [Fusarium oxysporum f. sp. conglutinans]